MIIRQDFVNIVRNFEKKKSPETNDGKSIEKVAEYFSVSAFSATTRGRKPKIPNEVQNAREEQSPLISRTIQWVTRKMLSSIMILSTDTLAEFSALDCFCDRQSRRSLLIENTIYSNNQRKTAESIANT